MIRAYATFTLLKLSLRRPIEARPINLSFAMHVGRKFQINRIDDSFYSEYCHSLRKGNGRITPDPVFRIREPHDLWKGRFWERHMEAQAT